MEKKSTPEYDPVISSSAGTCYRSAITSSKGIEQSSDLEIARNFLVGLFFMTHQAQDCANPGSTESFSFECSACGEFTEYYRRPNSGYTPPLCLSIPCLAKRMVNYRGSGTYNDSDNEDDATHEQHAQPDEENFSEEDQPHRDEHASHEGVAYGDEILVDDASEEESEEGHKKNK